MTHPKYDSEKLRLEIAELRRDKERLDWLEGELAREAVNMFPLALFRRNRPITRADIDDSRARHESVLGNERLARSEESTPLVPTPRLTNMDVPTDGQLDAIAAGDGPETAVRTEPTPEDLSL